MFYRRSGRSGLLFPALSLGLWHNFSESADFENCCAMVRTAWENGITQFDLANNYGPPPGSAEWTFGRILKRDFEGLRNQMLITSKAGHEMWAGPYGDWSSKKHLIASCDESLVRLGVDYLDIFYAHRPDPETPLEETVGALEQIVRSGRALYIGLSKYPVDRLTQAVAMLRERNVPVVVDQLKYSLLHRAPEAAHFEAHKALGLGCVSFSPLAQGQLTDRYLGGIPSDSRAATGGFLNSDEVAKNIEKVRALKSLADQRGQSLAQMAVAWQLSDLRVTSVIVGASRPAQLIDTLGALKHRAFSAEELEKINQITL